MTLQEKKRMWQKNWLMKNQDRMKFLRKRWRRENLAKAKSALKKWRKQNVEHEKAWRQKYHKLHRAYRLEWTRNWRIRNILKVRTYAKQYSLRKDVRARAVHHARLTRIKRRQVEGTFTIAEWTALKEKWGNRCAYCGAVRPLTVDHVHPLARGGTNYITNILPACKPCNCAKKAKTLGEWKPERRQNVYKV